MATAPETATRVAVVGTAGHIDHGKTAMVRRLTGVDTDRLPEEKKRGISIDLGFAPLTTPAGVRVGIVDVPGHERFVKNMLAGVGGIDLVLLVIAADEGVMPQTREHLAILKLLGIPRGIIVLTKRDLVEAEWVQMVRRDVAALVAGTALEAAPVIEFSAVTGAGTQELLAAMDAQLATLTPRTLDDPARLPVDRVFTVEGFGTVVTGTLWRGRIKTGEALELLPGRLPVRVRRLQTHGVTVEESHAGQRTAVAIHGVDRDEVERGDWLIAPGSMQPSRLIDVRFELLADYPRAWRKDVRVRFHLGAGEHIGRLLLLEGTELQPGESALAQVRLEKPAAPARGDRFVIRSYSPARTVGGGSVIEPLAGRRKRGQRAALDTLSLRESGSLDARALERLAALEKPTSTAVLAKAVSASEGDTSAALGRLALALEAIEVASGRWIAGTRWTHATTEIEGAVIEYVRKHPARYGVMKGELKNGLKTALDASLFDASFESLLAAGRLEQRGERVRPTSLPWTPPEQTMEALEKVEAELERAGLAVPETAAWQKKLGADAAEVVALGLFLGRLVRVSQEYTYTTPQLEGLRAKLAAWFDTHPTLSVAEFKELSGVSRKWAVPLLEYSDRNGWTVRSGDERKRG